MTRPGRPPSRKVLVLGKDTRAFLSVIRSLGRRGLQVHAAWCDPRSPAARSRYIHRLHEIPAPALEHVGWRDRLLRLLDREDFDLVIPCNDASILPLQHRRRDLETHRHRLYLLDDVAFRIAFDKLASHDVARSLGIPVARQVRVSCLDELAGVLPSLSWPVVVKPRASFTPDRLDRKHHVRTAREPGELARRVEALLPWGDVAVEDFFPGRGVGVEVLAHQGRVLLSFQHERLHEPPTGGGSSYRRSTAPHPELLDATTRFLGALGYTGVAMLEFRLDPTTGRWIFIEINGRFWGSLPLALAAGADFPYHLYEMWVHGRRDFPQGYRTGVACRNLVNDLSWLRKSWRAGPHDPAPPTVPRWRLPLELAGLLTLRDHSDTFVVDDPWPGLAELGHLGRQAMRGARRRSRRLADVRPAFRRYRARQARRALRKADRVLFVCKGNICRSPFAHRLAELVLPTLVVASAGLHPEPARPCPDEAVEVAAELGVDLRPYRSRVLSPDMLDDADVVFVFDEDNYDVLRERYPSAMPKTHFLGVLGARPTVAIQDPYGGTRADFRAAYAAIRECLIAAAGPLPACAGASVGGQGLATSDATGRSAPPG